MMTEHIDLYCRGLSKYRKSAMKESMKALCTSTTCVSKMDTLCAVTVIMTAISFKVLNRTERRYIALFFTAAIRLVV